MINALKKNLPTNYLILLIFAVILWGFKFLYLSVETEYVFADSLLNIELPKTQFWSFFSEFIAFGLFFLIAFLLNNTNLKISIIKSAYQSPGFIVIVLSGLFLGLQRLTPELLANIFVLLSINRILTIHSKHNAFTNFYDSGLLLSLASFFYINIIALSVVILIIAFILRIFNLREFIVFFMGLATPFVFFAGYLFLYKDINFLQEFLEQEFFKQNTEKYTSLNFIISLILFIMLIASIIYRIFVSNFKKLVTRKYINISIFLCVIFSGYYVSPYSGIESMIFLFVPISLLIANFFVNTDKIISSVLIYGLIASVLVIQGIQIMYVLSNQPGY